MTTPSIKWQLDQLIKKEQLPVAYLDLVNRYLLPLASQINAWREASASPLVLGINGGQGTGKSTICLFITRLMKALYQQRCVILSIDDFYLSKHARRELAVSEHPLFVTRGVPATHDVDLAFKTVHQLLIGEPTALPVFNKAEDDLLPQNQWPIQTDRADIILFEGWCVGAKPIASEALVTPLNALEADEDTDGKWRTYSNTRLASDYQQLFGLLDVLVMLKAPSMETIVQWRNLQEQKLAAKVSDQNASGLMSEQQIQRFIQHYERLTRHMLSEMPQRADVVFNLDVDHQIASAVGLAHTDTANIEDGQ